jgi:peroxin-3
VYSSNWENEIRPVNEDLKDGPVDAADVATGQESIVDIGSASAFESAWGKAVEKDSPA